MTRADALKTVVCTSTHYSKLSERMTEAEFDEMVAFADDWEDVGHLEFESQVNRMFLDGRRDAGFRKKIQPIACELLLAANTLAKGRPR